MKNKYNIFFLVLGLLLGTIVTVRAQQLKAPEYGRGYDIGTTSSGITIKGNVLYMTWSSIAARKKRWLVAVDISNPATPKLLSKLSLPGFPQDLSISASCAYVVNGQDMIIIDISSPKALKRLKNMRISTDPLKGPQGIEILGKTAWLACRRGGIMTIDISNPKIPKKLAHCPVKGFVRDLSTDGKRIYAALDTRGFAIINIADSKPEIIKQMKTPTGSIGRICVQANIAYMAGGEDVVICVSVKNPDKPALLGSSSDRHSLSPLFGVYSHDLVLYRGGNGKLFACVADGEGGLNISNVNDTANPNFCSALMTGVRNGNSNRASSIAAKGNFLFLNDDSFGLRICDISNPIKPKLVGNGLNLKTIIALPINKR